MPGIVWHDAFSVGSIAIDDQHKKWFELYNDMRMCAKTYDTGLDAKKVIEALKKMMDYSAAHFKFEETYMKEIGYPDLEDHANSHGRFNETVNSFYQEFLSGNPVHCSELVEFVKDWLLRHIADEDRAYGVFSQKP